MDNFRLMFALGFWKKLVYTMSVPESLFLCYKFNDVRNYEVLMEKTSEAQGDRPTLIVLKHVSALLLKHFGAIKRQRLTSYEQLKDSLRQIQLDLQLA